MNKYLLLACALTLSACSESNTDLHEWMENTSQQTKTKLAKPKYAELDLQPRYTPPPQPKMNMFDPARLKAGLQGANAPNMNRPKEILENYSLDDLHYVGLIKSDGQTPSAFIEVNGHVYTVKQGNYLGSNFGRIISITPDEIILSEQIENSSGEWTNHQASLTLQAQGNE